MRAIGTNVELKTGSVIISYNDQGHDNVPVIIFIHGLALNKTMWEKQEAALKNNYRVISYDVRGHGKSQAGNEYFSIELFTDDLIHFMDILMIDQATICGLSMGGYIALRAMEKYPERFSALVLADTQCTADTPEGKEKRMNTIKGIKENGKAGFAEQNAKNVFSPESFTTRKAETDAVVQMAIEMQSVDICNTVLALANRNETCSSLEEIKVPTLIMVGNNDKLIPAEKSQYIHQHIKGSELRILEHAAHLSNVENADAFNSALKSFMQGVFKGS